MIYTIFQLVVSATFFAAVVAYVKLVGDAQPDLARILLGIGSMLLLVAFAAGGVIASQLSRYNDYESFTTEILRPRLLENTGIGWKYDTWSSIQLIAFALGSAMILFALALGRVHA
jgi:hypothetical protein